MKQKRKQKSSGLSVFDHVKHIRQVQDPDYYINLNDSDKKTFNQFMILRALSMDSSIVCEMAYLYKYVNKIPPAQFYTLLTSIVPKSKMFFPWIKTKKMKNKSELLELVAKRFEVATYQANEYINLLLRTPEGQDELVMICRSFGMDDKELEKLFAVD